MAHKRGNIYEWRRLVAELFEEDKPYATMKDGPDKYLFRKDNKQKLVGSADNEPEADEVELEEEETDGYRYREELGTRPNTYYLPPVNRMFDYRDGLEDLPEEKKKIYDEIINDNGELKV